MRLKKILLCFVSVMIILPCLFVGVSAADSASITVNTSKPDVGKTITVNLNFSSSLKLYTTTGTLTYNTSVLKYVSGGASVSGSTISLYKDHTGEKNTSYSIVFKTISEGSSALDFHIEGSDGEKKSTANASRSIVVAKPLPSSNANLSYLSVSDGVLVPSFSPTRTNYTVTVRNDVAKIKIFANVSDGGATFDGAGSYRINDGLNEHTVTVTAANGSKKTYTVTVKRLTEEETKKLDEEARKNDSLLTIIDGQDYHILKSVSGKKIPKNFKETEVEYNGKKISVIKENSNKYALYGLKRDSDSKFFWYILDKDVFVPANYVMFNDNMYIVENFPDETVNISNEWYLDIFDVSKKLTVDAYVSKDERLSDFCVLYCYFDGKSEYYRYDKHTQTLQRYPDFIKLEKSSDISEGETEETEETNISNSFGKIPTEGKYVITGILSAIVLSVALIVLLALKSRAKTDYLKKLSYDEYVSGDDTDE